MDASEIKANLNKKVRYKNASSGLDADYILSGAIFRKGQRGYYYQAELQDIKSQRSIVICNLEDITSKEEKG